MTISHLGCRLSVPGRRKPARTEGPVGLGELDDLEVVSIRVGHRGEPRPSRLPVLEDAPNHWPDHFGSWRLPDLRAIILHVITETACHAGHLDAARELIDGNTWLILD